MSKRKPEAIPSANRIHGWANLIVGFNLPRAFIRRLGTGRRITLIRYVNYVWLTANDNIVRRVQRPRWLPKKYCGW